MLGAPKAWAMLGLEAVAATTGYVLVDLSDTTNFKHTDENVIHLLGLVLSAEKASDGAYDIWVGVITEVDGTNGSAHWLHCWHLQSMDNATDSTDRFNGSVDFTANGANPNGLNLEIDKTAAAEKPRHFLSNEVLAGSTVFQNDQNMTSPAGATTKPGVGDLVVYVEETGGTGTIDFFLSAMYDTT